MPRFLFFAILAIPVVAPAATIDLAATPSRVRESHPGLKAARLAVEEARGRLLGAGRLSNPSLSFEFQSESGLSPRTTSLAIDQRLPLTKRLQLEKRISSRQVDEAELEVRDLERNLIAEAQALVVNLLALGRKRTLHERQAELAKELAEFAKDRSVQGEVSPLDAARAFAEAQRTLIVGRTLAAERAALLGDLKRVLGVPAQEELTVVGELPPLLPTAGERWDGRPDYHAARLKEETARTEIDLAEANRWEDVTAGLFAAKESQGIAGTGRDRADFMGVRLSVPLPLWNRNEGGIAEKEAGSRRAALETEALAAEIGNEAAAAREEMMALASLGNEMHVTLLPAIREQSDRLEQAYKVGETDLLTVLRAREQLIELEVAALDSARDFHLARVRYEAALGLHAPAAPSSR